MTLNDESDLHVFCLIDVLDYGSLIFRMVGHILKMTFYSHKLGIVCRPDTFLNLAEHCAITMLSHEVTIHTSGTF